MHTVDGSPGLCRPGLVHTVKGSPGLCRTGLGHAHMGSPGAQAILPKHNLTDEEFEKLLAWKHSAGDV